MRLRRGIVATGLLFVFGVVLCSPLALAYKGEEDPLWKKNRFQKKVGAIGRQILKDNGVDEKIAFILDNGSGAENVNAYAYRSYAKVYMERELLNYMDNDDELAGILSHEIAHILMRHNRFRGLKQGIATTVITTPFMVAGVLAGPAGVAGGTSLGLGLSKLFNHVTGTQSQRGMEKQADIVAVQLMSNAGYDPNGFIDILEKISGDGSRATIWRDHPASGDRIESVIKAVAVLKETDGKEAIVEERDHRPPFRWQKSYKYTYKASKRKISKKDMDQAVAAFEQERAAMLAADEAEDEVVTGKSETVAKKREPALKPAEDVPVNAMVITDPDTIQMLEEMHLDE
ncbi:MAG: M48 family metalloprotease [Candidatus Melainabacteria bacterium]